MATSDNIRVLHLRTVTGKGGGPEKTILNSPRYIGPGYEMRLAYIRPRQDPEYDLPERARNLGVELIDIPESGPLDPRSIRQLAAVIREFRPHIVHAHDYKTNFLTIMLRRWFRFAAMTTMHGNGVWGRRLSLYYRVDRWSLPRMDHIVTVSRNMRDLVLSFGVEPDRCSVIHNAIDSDLFRRSRDSAQLRRQFGIPADRTIIGAVGRLSAEKGFDLLITAVNQAFQSGHNVHLILVGDGGERESLERLIAKLGCQDRVQLLGHRSDVIDLYHCMDMYVLSSHREALPNVVLEAMSMEVPVIATRVAGVPDVIQDGSNGVLVDPNDLPGLTKAISRLACDPVLGHQLGQSARLTVDRQYSFKERMQKVRTVYETLVE